MCIADITGLEHEKAWLTVALIDKGWSTDQKYRISTLEGQQLLCRLASMEEYTRK